MRIRTRIRLLIGYIKVYAAVANKSDEMNHVKHFIRCLALRFC